jgi:hypothetical protein
MEPREQRRRREEILASVYDPEADADEDEQFYANGAAHDERIFFQTAALCRLLFRPCS